MLQKGDILLYKDVLYYTPNKTYDNMMKVAIVMFMLYAYSRLSWGYFVSNIGWGIDLLLAVSLMFFPFILKKRISIYKDVNILLFLGMLIIISFNNNYDIAEYGFLGTALPYYCMFVIYVAGSTNGGWIKTAVQMMVLVGIIYALFTIVCSINNEFYYSNIVPIMSRYNTSYTPHPSAGFTAHYSTNGIYLSVGFCAMTGIILFGRKKNLFNVHFIELTFFIILLLALFMNGKSGTLICILAAVFLAYRNYTIMQRRGRIFKLITVVIVIVTLLYILSMFIPSIAYTVERFSLESSEGDISNGRFALWGYIWLLIQQNFTPMGLGWRWFRYNNILIPNTDAHNCFLQLILENGFIGSLPFMIFMVIAFYRAYKLSIEVRNGTLRYTDKDVAYIYVAFIQEVFMIVYLLEGTALYMPECMFTYFISCTIIEFYRRISRSSKKLENK